MEPLARLSAATCLDGPAELKCDRGAGLGLGEGRQLVLEHRELVGEIVADDVRARTFPGPEHCFGDARPAGD